MLARRCDGRRGSTESGTRLRVGIALIASLVALAILPAGAVAAPDRSGTVNETTPFEWDGVVANGSNTNYDPATGTPCPPAPPPPRTPATQCDMTLLHITSAVFGGVDVSIAENNTVAPPADFDLYIYASDSTGTRGDLVSSSAGPTGTESASIDAASGYYLVQVVYFDVTGENYHGRAAFFRRDQFPADVDNPPGFQDALASDPARNFRSHSEPHIAQNPTNPNMLVAASKMYNLDPDSLAEYEFKIGTYASFDGGQTWSDLGQLDVCPPADAPPPSWPSNTCYPADNPALGGTGDEDVGDPRGTGDFGEEYITSDVWVQFDDEGNAYAMVLDSPPFPGGAGWGMTLHKWQTPTPADIVAGNTWSRRQPINSYPAAASDPNFGTLDDKNTFAVNNAGPDGDGTTGTMVGCWTRDNGDPNLPPQQIVCERSTDGGATWPGTPQAVSGNQLLEIGVDVVADTRNPNVFYATWLHYLPGALGLGLPDEMAFTRSTDGGQTWEPPRTVAELTSIPNSFPGQAFRNLSIPIMAAGPNSELYIVYSDYRDAPQANDEDGQQADVMMVRSPDGGNSWFKPVKVNQDATNADQFQPYVAVNPGGQVNVAYFDRRLDVRRTEGATVVHPGNFFIDAWLSRSNDGGNTFADTRVSHETWDPTINPPVSGSGQFIGDYQGLVADCSNAIPFMNDTHLANAPSRDPEFDGGYPRSVFQEVFSWRVPNTPTFGGAACPASPPQQQTGPIGPQGLGTPTTTVASGLAISRRRVRISRSGIASIRVKCRSATACRGRLDLFRFVTRRGQPVSRITVGAHRFRLAAGRKGVVRVRITSTQRRLARRRGRLAVVAVANARFVSGARARASARVTLLPARR
jgi:hypothetical protein